MNNEPYTRIQDYGVKNYYDLKSEFSVKALRIILACMAALTFFISLSVLGAGFVTEYYTKQAIKDFTATAATVTEHRQAINHSSKHSKYWVAQYKVNGKIYEAQSLISTNIESKILPVGSKVEIKYNPQNPGKNVVTKEANLISNIIKIAGLVILMLSLIPLLIFIKLGKNK